jgi:hypothetical protein
MSSSYPNPSIDQTIGKAFEGFFLPQLDFIVIQGSVSFGIFFFFVVATQT